MALSTPQAEITEDLLNTFYEIERILDLTYGPRPITPNGRPLDTLIGTILSQSTSDVNSSRAMARLQQEFPTWEDVLDAPVEDVIDAIRSGGLANIKGPRIQNVLRRIHEREGGWDLRFLARMPLDDAMTWLVSLDGVGPKTAACVLLFALGMPAMPVDTHVGRVMTRLGVLPTRASTIRQQRRLEALIGPMPSRVYAVHVETIEHGRHICRAAKPRCPVCPLKEVCLYYAEHHA